MASLAIQRVKREFKEVVTSSEAENSQIKLEMVAENLKHLQGEIKGPPDTPFEGATFILDILIPDSYPFNPPKVKFATKIWHPNISSATGAICLDILKDQWAAAMTLRTVLLSIQALLASAEPDDPQDAVVAKQYKETPEIYHMTAKFWAEFFAGGNPSSYSADLRQKVKSLCDMGIQSLDAVRALSHYNWDATTAVESIFS
ncbi:Ubiquitin-conjugating enzyme E2 K-like [Oopsacas minuta]|uniref:Ubiquitin-conjugating enzyme E2 K-like n=1 Tax=Oopsacas minuta TaxID=111878 RepID=A0AAV7K5G6_9METZ|nr:Ubiquitin-conjugating enzyme E2 K-like [Oopsacas minuta]